MLARVPRDCQERLVWPAVFPAKRVPKAGPREDWLVAGSWGLGGLKLADDFIRASWRKRIQPGWSCPGREATSQAPRRASSRDKCAGRSGEE